MNESEALAEIRLICKAALGPHVLIPAYMALTRIQGIIEQVGPEESDV